MIQLGIRLHDVPGDTLAKRVDKAVGQGFSCAHLALSKAVQEFSTANSALTPGLAMWMRRLFAERGMDIAVLGCYKNLAHPEPDKLREIQRTYEAHLLFASLLGCGMVGTETGAPNGDYAYEPACHTSEALLRFMRGLAPVLEMAERLGVIIALEPVWTHIVWNPRLAHTVLRQMESPNLKIILDPVNLLSAENYEQREDVFAEAIDLLGEDVAEVHLKDFRPQGSELLQLAPGEGIMDYRSIMSFLKHDKPYIQATLENTVPENAVRALQAMQRAYDEA